MLFLDVGQDVFSINCARIGVRDIGRRSFVGLISGFTLGIGTTSALFHIAGVKLSPRELLNIPRISFVIVLESYFKIQFGMESGPMALDILMLESCFSTSSGVMMNLPGIGS